MITATVVALLAAAEPVPSPAANVLTLDDALAIAAIHQPQIADHRVACAAVATQRSKAACWTRSPPRQRRTNDAQSSH